jgi:flagellar biosynthesis/type III secretory pathway chaperone
MTEFLNILKEEQNISKDLLKISKSKTQAIKENDIGGIDSLVKVESALVMKFSALERNRNSLCEIMRESLGLSGADFNMTELKTKTTNENYRYIDDLQKNMKRTLDELQEVGKLNDTLIKSRLDWINISMRVLGRRDEKSNTIDERI